MMMKNETLVVTLVQNLLYPSILGAMFYNFLPVFFELEIILNNKLLFLSTVILFCHFFIDYVFTLKFPSYGLTVGIIDTIALVLVYRTEFHLNPILNPEFTSHPPILLMIVNILFLAWDIVYKEWKLIWLNLFAVVAYSTCAYYYTNIVFFIAIQLVMLGVLSKSFHVKIVELKVSTPEKQ